MSTTTVVFGSTIAYGVIQTSLSVLLSTVFYLGEGSRVLRLRKFSVVTLRTVTDSVWATLAISLVATPGTIVN